MKISMFHVKRSIRIISCLMGVIILFLLMRTVIMMSSARIDKDEEVRAILSQEIEEYGEDNTN